MHSADSSSAENTFRANFSEMCQQAWRELARRSFRKSFRFPDNASHNWFPGHMHKYGWQFKIMFSSPLWNTGAWDPCREKSGTLIVFWRSVPQYILLFFCLSIILWLNSCRFMMQEFLLVEGTSHSEMLLEERDLTSWSSTRLTWSLNQIKRQSGRSRWGRARTYRGFCSQTASPSIAHRLPPSFQRCQNL